jgi:hypothetical protein
LTNRIFLVLNRGHRAELSESRPLGAAGSRASLANSGCTLELVVQ